MSELWKWYHETELIEDEDDDISYEDRFIYRIKFNPTRNSGAFSASNVF